MDSSTGSGSSGTARGDPDSLSFTYTASTRTKILAYLGELKPGEFIPVRKLIYDLNLRFTTAKNVLTQLEEEWIVEKSIRTTRGTIALFRIAPTAVMVRTVQAAVNEKQQQEQALDLVPYVPPEWRAEYGQHPYGL